jgi:hypothetical protein
MVMNRNLPHRVILLKESENKFLTIKQWCVQMFGQCWDPSRNRNGAWEVLWVGPATWDVLWGGPRNDHDHEYTWNFKNKSDAMLFRLKWL